ncbi:hypothetical protein FAF44_52185, partial [Nonomuraea sp. MG754425]|uniref:hypothetical protein n=1 Tax=Nonomuraea sp. MG754425 TaxID=2570319 RepID=UPI001F3EF58F
MTHASTTAARRLVSPRHARALANYGPGWAIMWDDRHDQPVIVPSERGDDGTLLEICDYEDMFTLGGNCDTREDTHTCHACTTGGPPDCHMIAAHMTNILGGYYDTRDDIAACMPLTLPYTRALTQHGFQRHAQGVRYHGAGNRHHDTFNQLYRSPDRHLIRLIIPLTPTPAPAPPLRIKWIYLGRTGT